MIITDIRLDFESNILGKEIGKLNVLGQVQAADLPQLNDYQVHFAFDFGRDTSGTGNKNSYMS